MEEKIVKIILKNYLEKRDGKPIKLKKDSASGPDFVIEGKAYECKGSKINKQNLFSQLLAYGFQYSSINLVIPYDAINFTFLWQMEAIEKFTREDPNIERGFNLYLVAETDQEDTYAICRWVPRMINLEISKVLSELIPNFVAISLIEEKEKKINEFLENIEENIKSELRKLVIKKAKESNSIWDGGLIEIQK